MAAGDHFGDKTREDPFQGIEKESDEPVLPSHGTLDIACTGAPAADRMQVRTFRGARNNDAAGKRSEQIGDDTGDEQLQFL